MYHVPLHTWLYLNSLDKICSVFLRQHFASAIYSSCADVFDRLFVMTNVETVQVMKRLRSLMNVHEKTIAQIVQLGKYIYCHS